MELIDSHCHLDDDRLAGRQFEVINSAINAGISNFIVPATTQQRWPLLDQLDLLYPQIHVAYGLHPMFMSQHTLVDSTVLEKRIDSHHCVAVGECGLDFFHGNDDRQAQLELFEMHLDIAKNTSLPCIIHSRKSLDIVISMLRKKSLSGAGVVHSFSGSLQQAQQLIDLGFKLGIAATVCFERAKKLQSIVSKVSLNDIVLESDAPDQTGPDFKGKLNEPLFMFSQLRKVAELKDTEEQDVAELTTKNVKTLFQLSA